MGSLLEPKVKGVERVRARLNIMPIDMDVTRRPGTAERIGELSKDGATLEAFVISPWTAISMVMPALTEKKVWKLILMAERLRYSRAPIQSFVIDRKRDHAD
jgi:hypothetical protein